MLQNMWEIFTRSILSMENDEKIYGVSSFSTFLLPFPDSTINYTIHRRFSQSVSFVQSKKKKDEQEKNETKIIG